MTPLFALRALLFAGELLGGSLLVMALASAFAAQKNASARHLAWAGAFGAALMLPLFAAILPSPLRILLPAPPAEIPLQTLSAAATLSAPAARGLSLDPATLALALGVLWLSGVCFIALRLGVGLFCLATLRRHSRPFALTPEALPRVSATHRECELRLSDSENGPITWGAFRPVILLPRTAIFWPRERLHAVLLHELAHIRRRDSLVQALSLFVCALYWPNPLVWLGARALRREAEIAADDSVIVAGVKPSSYASELLQLAREFRTRAPAFSALSFFMAAPSALEARIESVLEPTSLRTGVTAMDVFKMAGLGLIAAGAIAFACPSLAQDMQAPPVETAPLPPAVPSAPAAPETPPAPPAPPVVAAPADAAAPAFGVRIDGEGRMHRLTRADRQRMHIAVARARREAHEAIEKARPEIDAAVARATRAAQEAVAKAGPEIDRAIAEAKIGEQAARAVHDAQPAIDAAVDEAISKYDSRNALAEARPEIDRALAEAQTEIARAHIDMKIQERVNVALQRAQRKLDAAAARDGRANDSSDNDDSQ